MPGVRLFGIALALVALAAAPTAARAEDATELSHLHVLLVGDTSQAGGIGPAVKQDLRLVREALARGVPAERLSVTELVGDDAASAEQVLAKARGLTAGPDQAVFLFFSGHGERKSGEHWLLLAGDRDRVARSALRQALQDTGAGLVVLVSEACNLSVDSPSRRPRTPPGPGARLLAPGLGRLFFLSRGLVDINSSSEETLAWQDGDGGLFSGVLAARLAAAGNSATITWPEFCRGLWDETRKAFREFKTRAERDGYRGFHERDKNYLLRQAAQEPQFYSLIGAQVLAVVTAETNAGQAVGAKVKEVYSPADSALRRGQVITAIDGHPTATAAECIERVNAAILRGQRSMHVRLYRGGDLEVPLP